MKKISPKFVFSVIVFLLVSLLPFAVSLSHVNAQAYRGIILNAFRFDIDTVKPGESITKTFTVKYDFQPNPDGTYRPANLVLTAQNFNQDNLRDGAPRFLEDGSLDRTESLANWITFDKDIITLSGPGETAEVTFTINVPEDAQPGGKYAAVFLNNKDGDIETGNLTQKGLSGFGLNASVGPLIFLTVDGDIKTNLELVDVYTTNIKDKKASLFFNPPINIVVSFKNTGNIHVMPRGRVYIYRSGNFLSNPVASFDLNQSGGVVLPNTTREYIIPWTDSFILTEKSVVNDECIEESINVDGEKECQGGEEIKYKTKYDFNNLSGLRLGKYKVAVQYDYEDETGTAIPSVIASASFWVIPWPLILLTILIVSAVVLYAAYKGFKKYSVKEESSKGFASIKKKSVKKS